MVTIILLTLWTLVLNPKIDDYITMSISVDNDIAKKGDTLTLYVEFSNFSDKKIEIFPLAIFYLSHKDYEQIYIDPFPNEYDRYYLSQIMDLSEDINEKAEIQGKWIVPVMDLTESILIDAGKSYTLQFILYTSDPFFFEGDNVIQCIYNSDHYKKKNKRKDKAGFYNNLSSEFIHLCLNI